VVAALVAGTATAMVVTQSLRSDGPIATNIRLKVKPDRYRPCFRLTKDDVVDVAIVDSQGRVIRDLAHDEPLQGEDAAHCYDWDGLDQNGKLVPAGRYRLRLSLAEADRVATSGERLRIPAAGLRQ
jgi:hypothetical protein